MLWAAPNLIEEAELSSGLDTALRHGRLIELDNQGHAFAAIWDEARSVEPIGCAILLPEAGARADSTVLNGLRAVLPAHGWHTLSLQLPVLEAEAEEGEYFSLLPNASQRMEVAIAYLKKRGIGDLILIGHGFGALVALNRLSLEGKSPVRGIILLSPWWPRQKQEELAGWLSGLRVPVLDIYAERDRPAILAAHNERYHLLKKIPGFRQWRISGTGHDYWGREKTLAKRIYGWLKTLNPAPGKRAGQTTGSE